MDIINIVIFSIFLGSLIYIFLRLPKNQKIKAIKEIIYSLVLMAERELGDKTGQAKFAFVISSFMNKYSNLLNRYITVDMIEEFIEESVKRMDKWFKDNPEGKKSVLK